MAENPEEALSEQRIIENYLHEYRIEDVIDEIVNQVVISRPANPYLEMAAAFESKTLPEILDIHVTSLTYYGSYGVKAVIITNVGTFSGSAPYNYDITNLYLEPKDYTVLDGKLKELLTPINPQNFKQIEEAILSIPEIEQAESLALGIAAIRAVAKFKGVKPYELIAELASNKEENIQIPLPVPVIASLNVPNTKAIKTIQIFPVKSSTFESAFTRLNQLFNRILLHEKVSKPAKFSPYGNALVDIPSIEDLMKLIIAIIQDAGEDSSFKIGVSHQGEQVMKPNDPPTPVQQYFNSAGLVKTGQELIEQLLITWGEVDCISVDSIVAAMDIQAMRHFKKRIQEFLFEARNAGNKLPYCSKGIGNDATCNLQIPLEGSFLLSVSTQDMEKQLLELPYNAVKLHLSSVKSISKAIEVCDRARELNLPIILDTSSILHKYQYSSLDTFEADFAVGVGAKQFYGNGLYDTSYSCKLNRLQEIIDESNQRIPFVGSKFRSSNDEI